MSNINNQTQSFSAVSAIEELADKTTANIQGGASVWHTGINPDIKLYKHDLHHKGANPWLGVKSTRAGVGDQNIGITRGRINGFNDQVSFIKVVRGTWDLFAHTNYRGYMGTVVAGRWYNLPGKLNDSISSIRRTA